MGHNHEVSVPHGERTLQGAYRTETSIPTICGEIRDEMIVQAQKRKKSCCGIKTGFLTDRMLQTTPRGKWLQFRRIRRLSWSEAAVLL